MNCHCPQWAKKKKVLICITEEWGLFFLQIFFVKSKFSRLFFAFLQIIEHFICHCFFANLALMVTQEVVVVLLLLVVRKCHDLFIIVDRLLLRDHKSLSSQSQLRHDASSWLESYSMNRNASRRGETGAVYTESVDCRVSFSFGVGTVGLNIEK